MATVSPELRKLTTTIRHNIRRLREAGELAIPEGLRVSVVSSPGLACSSVDVTIVDAPASWSTMETRDLFDNPSRKISAEAKTVGDAIAAMIREEGVGTYAGFVYADCVLIGVYTRH